MRKNDTQSLVALKIGVADLITGSFNIPGRYLMDNMSKRLKIATDLETKEIRRKLRKKNYKRH